MGGRSDRNNRTKDVLNIDEVRVGDNEIECCIMFYTLFNWETSR